MIDSINSGYSEETLFAKMFARESKAQEEYSDTSSSDWKSSVSIDTDDDGNDLKHPPKLIENLRSNFVRKNVTIDGLEKLP